MKKIYIYFIALFIVAFSACKNERMERFEVTDEDVTAELKSPGRSNLLIYGKPIPGKVIIEISEDLLEEMKVSDRGVLQMNSAPSQMQAAFGMLKATKVERLFKVDPRFEGRKKRMGMHLWYEVTIDKNMDMEVALQTMSEVPGVKHVEYEPVMQTLSDGFSPTFTPFNYQDRTDNYPFDDPRLKDQWHYNNTATLPRSEVGADINLFKAWEVTTGTPNVIVSVVDGGLSINHEDIKDNLWINEKEFNGEPGVDDDGNGYIDDIYGYNFVKGNSTIEPDADFHGTHVAGTVAAVNNNGIGVCGVAGGNGEPGSGVRLMSCNVFAGERGVGGFNSAIVYGADNGAVISQNSWGNTVPGPTSPATKKAIDYFRKYAGCDDDGNQLPDSPMKGGVVIIASGNDDSEERYAPGEYEPAIAVNAMAPDYKKATYSNYGTWTDIMAPGGDQFRFGNRGGVLSTVGTQEYVYYHGTSMACPHVSGIAALVVSVRGGQGFTATELEEILLAATLPVDIDEKNPQYAGKLGVGYIDAYAAVTIRNEKKNPETPKFLPEKSKEDKFEEITVHWQVPRDEDDGAPSKYRLYYSPKELNKSNYKTGIKVGNASGFVSGQGREAGDEMNFRITGLNHSSTYYFAIVAVDRWGHESQPSFMSAKTKINLPPEITNMPTEPIVLIDMLGSTKYEFNVKDLEGHKWTYELSGDTKGITATQKENSLEVLIRNVLDAGDYSLTITLTDALKSSKSFEVPFRIVEVTAPKLVKEIPEVLLGVDNGPLVIDLNEFFEPQEHFNLNYEATASDGTAVGTEVDNSGKLTLTGFKPAKTTINIKATNGYKETNTFFSASVTKDSNRDVYAVWPLPVKNELNIWLNPKVTNAKVTIHSITGQLVLDKSVTGDAQGICKIATKKLAPGSYRLRIDAGTQPYERVIQKR